MNLKLKLKLERIAMSILAMLPLKAVAFAAESRLTTITGKEANVQKSWNSLLAGKSLLFEAYQLRTTRVEAFERFKEKSGLQNSSEAEVQFNSLVDQMILDGTITTSEEAIESLIPSEH